MALAERTGHPLSYLAGRTWYVILGVLRREPSRVEAGAAHAVAVAEEHGISPAMWADSFQGWILGQRGRAQEGLEVMRSRFEERATVGQDAFRACYLALMADLYGRAGRLEEGLECISRSFEVSSRHASHWFDAEYHRIRGELLRQLDRPAAEIEECFREAIEVATTQGALAWKLRAAASLARLQASHGANKEARDLLAPVYDQFTEGFDLADLKDAKALLDELG